MPQRWNSFCSALDVHRNNVARHFEQVFALPQAEGEQHDDQQGEQCGLQRIATAAPQQTPPPVQQAYQQPRRPDFVDSDHHHQSGYGKRKHKSWLSDIFD